jgi:patatin-related protein
MSGAASIAGPSIPQENVYARELRFGVVMYGGVSLAIYINGVSNELYEMACATPKIDVGRNVGGTRDVYRKASWLLHDPDLHQRYLAHLKNPQDVPDPLCDKAQLKAAQQTRFVVDTIAGTSAGGINGLFLAKALANGQDFAPLKKLWVQEGDIATLLNDDASYEGLKFAKTGSPPQSLLNSDRMYIKLLDAFQNMATAMKPTSAGESPLVDEIDLFITTTDIRGAVVPLRLFDKVVYEKRYKQVYHFQYATGQKPSNDFADDNIPFLAFAARCTSSFPFAFEPMSVVDAERLCEARPTSGRVDFAKWKSFFTGLSSNDMAKERWRSRAFGDGGYLDNKPFSYVVDALSWRLGGLPMERKLIYVEPAPTHPEKERQDFPAKPDAIQNAVAALFSIPHDETIREDLEAVLARNRRIERVERIVRDGEADIETRSDDPFARIVLAEGKVPKWRTRDMGDMVAYYGLAFLPYRHLRMMTVTDDIADRLAVWWSIDRRSDRLYALRAIVRAWREDKYYENRDQKIDGQAESVNAFLDDYDVKYRLRRTGFVLRKTHQLLSLIRKLRLPADKRDQMSDIEKCLLTRWQRQRPPLSSMNSDALLDVLGKLGHGFDDAMGELRATTWLSAPSQNEEARTKFGATLDRLLGLLLHEKLDPPLEELETLTGTKVEVPTIELPAPSPLRTLQENVFARASALFELAKRGSKTKIQASLEADVEALRIAYADVIRISPGRKVPLIRDLLGDPTLVPVDTTGEGAKSKVVIRIGDVALPGCASLNTPEGEAVRAFLAEYYVRFDEYDQMSFPLYYDTGTGEPATVEVLRVSPEDAGSLIDELRQRRRKLAGTAVFHFGAFLDARWRRNDIMWGRLDGCERLLAAMFPEIGDSEIREALLQEAQLTIVREELQPEGYGELIDHFASALAAQKEATLDKAFEGLWAHLGPAEDGQRRTQIARILKALLGDAGMLEYVRQYYEVNRELDTKMTFRTGARALTITGRILEESERARGAPSSKTVWLTRAGRALQVLLTISTPGSLGQGIFRHWLGLLYVFEALIVAGAMLFSAPSARSFGLTAFAITAVVHVASLVTGDLVNRKRGRILVLVGLIAIVVLLLALLGGLVLYNDGVAGIRHAVSSFAHQ